MTRFPPDKLVRQVQFWALGAFLILVAVTGGGSRSDIQSLIVLRPAAALSLGYALWFLPRAEFRSFRLLFGILIAAAALVAVQLVPLPPTIWQGMPGRALAAEAERAAELSDIWLPISLAPYQTWNAFYSFLVPAATLALFAGLPRERRFAVLPLLIIVTVVSGILGLMQVIGPAGGPLYLYRVTNESNAVGLFANRNHQAALLSCLFPMLATYATLSIQDHPPAQARMRLLLCAGTGLLFVPLLVVTGSRLGLIVGLIGVGSIPLLFMRPLRNKRASKNGKTSLFVYIGGSVAVAALVLATVMTSRSVAIDRFLSGAIDEDRRVALWETSVHMAGKYFPFGSGYGSFPMVYQIDEPDWSLGPTYGNHAHNEVLEVALTGGLLGLVLIGLAVIAWAVASLRAFRVTARDSRNVLFARLGSVIILILSVSSITDYPLRTPFLASVLVLAAVWLANGTARKTESRRKLV